uniref:HMA domain-containing protein n=1 Tax=Setaria viridis TaxID=4556 RepID=A0A4U6T0X7_SETVI|nr:hypothetical protein SEVIR_9G023900v2 [Setaria viridis]
MAPVILRTFVHCSCCAGRIRRAIKNYLGVEEVWVSVDTGLVVVAGTNLDASLLRWRVQSMIRKKHRVDIVSDGAAEEQPQYALPPPGYPYPYHYQYPYNSGGGGGMVPHLGPPPAYAQPPAPYPYAAAAAALGWVPEPPQHLLQYVPAELLHARRQYMPNEAPLWLNDENPNGCCSVQ